MDFKVKISNLPATLPSGRQLEGIGASGITWVTGTSLSFKASGYNSNDQLYQVIAALGLGDNNGCKVDISAMSVVNRDETATVKTGTVKTGTIEADKVMTLAQQTGAHHPQLNPEGNAKPKSPSSDDLVAVYYFTNAVLMELGCNGVEVSDIQGNFADGEAEFIAELADYAIMTSNVVTKLYSETGVALPGKFEYEVLTMGSPLIEEFVGYILDPKPSLPDMDEWGKMCMTFISAWIRKGEPLPIETILSGVKSGAYDLGWANLELRQHKIMVTSFCEVEGEFRIKSVM